MKNKVSESNVKFWDTAREYLYHHLPDIRNKSTNTVNAYRDSLNKYLDYLSTEKSILPQKVTFKDFTKANLTDYLDWMLNTQRYAEKTCNLRLTAIHSLLEYAASDNDIDLTAIYITACSVKPLKVTAKSIEYFEESQIKALMAAPNIKSKVGRRNQMMLVLYYDTAARISELLEMKLSQLHLKAEPPYLTILGKGRKYRNIPLMEKTIRHLKGYLKEFHSDSSLDMPLFYTITHGTAHLLSSDTVEKVIKQYSAACSAQGVDMPDKPHCHMIRKTRAMILYQQGVPLTHIQQLLGHEDLSTTSGFYAFATLDTLSKSLKKANSSESENTAKKWDDQNTLKQLYRL